VAIAAVPLGVLDERRHPFGRNADRLRPEMATSLPTTISHSGIPGVTERADQVVRMFQEYEPAARCPWLPLEPDPLGRGEGAAIALLEYLTDDPDAPGPEPDRVGGSPDG
jgi:hypothetical protein